MEAMAKLHQKQIKEKDLQIEKFQQIASQEQQINETQLIRNMRIKIDKLEEEEMKKHARKQYELQVYEKGLEKILDIQCSPFKSRLDREKIEDHLIGSLPSMSVNTAITYSHLKDIFQEDWRYCGSNAESNGKLRFLYAQQWKLQLDRDKYRNIVEGLKRMNVKVGEEKE